MDECIFCKVVKKELPSKPVHEDSDVIVIPDIFPQAPIHFLVIPKRHIEQFTDTENETILRLMNVAKRIIREKNIVGYRLVINGKGAAIIDHLHIHILGNVDQKRKL